MRLNDVRKADLIYYGACGDAITKPIIWLRVRGKFVIYSWWEIYICLVKSV